MAIRLRRGSALLVSLSAMLVGACHGGVQDRTQPDRGPETTALRAEIERLTQEKDAQRRAFEEVVIQLSEVQSAVDTVSREQGKLTLTVNDPEHVSGLARNDTSTAGQVLASIDDLKGKVKDGERKLDNLEKRLRELVFDVKGLNAMVLALRLTISEKEEQLEAMRTRAEASERRVAEIQGRVDEQAEEIRRQAVTILEAERRENEFHYLVGRRKDLVKLRVVEESTAFLGIGKKIMRKAKNLPERLFQVADARYTHQLEIPVPPEKLEILSSNPPGSYQVERRSPSESAIVIVDVTRFMSDRWVVVCYE